MTTMIIGVNKSSFNPPSHGLFVSHFQQLWRERLVSAEPRSLQSSANSIAVTMTWISVIRIHISTSSTMRTSDCKALPVW